MYTEIITPEGKLAIREETERLIKKYGAILGIANLVALLGIVLYSYSQINSWTNSATTNAEVEVKKSATEIAEKATQLYLAQYDRQSMDINKRLDSASQSLQDLFSKRGAVTERISMVAADTEEMRKGVEAIKASLPELRGETDDLKRLSGRANSQLQQMITLNLGLEAQAREVEKSIRIANEYDAAKLGRQLGAIQAYSEEAEIAESIKSNSVELSALRDEITQLDRAKSRVEGGQLSVHYSETPSIRDTNSCEAGDKGFRGLKNKRVNFQVPFNEAPTVLVGIQSYDMSDDNGAMRLQVRAHSIDSSGFSYNFVTWCYTSLYSANATWIAIGS